MLDSLKQARRDLRAEDLAEHWSTSRKAGANWFTAAKLAN